MKRLLILPFLMIALLTGCLDDSTGPEKEDDLAGGATSTGNTIAGVVAIPDGKESGDVSIRVRRKDFLAKTGSEMGSKINVDAVSSADISLDQDGAFKVANLDTGEYFIEITDENKLSTLKQIRIESMTSERNLGEVELKPMTQVTGQVSTTPGSGKVFIRVYGLERVVEPDSKGFFEVMVPEGSLVIHISQEDSKGPVTIPVEASPSDKPDSSNNIGNVHLAHAESPWLYPQWESRYKVTVNTGVQGANLNDNLKNYPLLIRLNKNNFDFNGALQDGSDIRFSLADSVTPLAYEVESWDIHEESAVIWVQVPEIKAGTEQEFIMYSGMDSARDSSSGQAVFDTSNGYGFVYHMNEDPGLEMIGIKDRTPHGFHGLVNGGMGFENQVDGVIGKAIKFDGVDDYIQPIGPEPGFFHDATDSRVISVWFKLSGDSTEQRQLIYEEGGMYAGFALTFNPATGAIEFATRIEGHLSPSILASSGDYSDKKDFIHAVGIFSEGTLRLIVNGWDDSTRTTSYTKVGKNDFPPGIGGTEESIHHTTKSFPGTVDEIRSSGTVRLGDWYRMDYASQVPGSDVVKISRGTPKD